jgi:ABC-2 type transport system ATP-binding protein
MPEAVLELRSLVRGYAQPVLTGVDLAVPRGTVMGLLGLNGAGKSTLLKCGLGILVPQSGSATVFGEPAIALADATKERIGYVPQAPSVFTWMRVRELIAFIGGFYPRWNHGLIDRLIGEWGVPQDAKVGTLSPGQAQQLNIFLALGHEPELLVLDEPASTLDPVARREFLRAVLGIALAGDRTVLFSTHITSDLERVADSVAVLQDGRITYAGSLDTLKDQGEKSLEDIFLELHHVG